MYCCASCAVMISHILLSEMKEVSYRVVFGSSRHDLVNNHAITLTPPAHARLRTVTMFSIYERLLVTERES